VPSALSDLEQTGFNPRCVTYNPYEAPRASVPGAPEGPLQLHAPQAWAVGETLSLAWGGFKRCWAVLMGTVLVQQVSGSAIGYLPTLLVATRTVVIDTPAYWIATAICLPSSFVIPCLLSPGLMRVCISVARGESPGFSLLSPDRKFWPFLGMLLLVYPAIALASLLCVVPGVMVAMATALSGFYLVDADMGVIESIRASADATKGHRGALFVLTVVCGAVAALGALACCVGTFVAISTAYVALAIVYVRLSGRGVAAAARP
jgi:hypothetical protein